MDNAEEVLQALEEFSKLKSKEIPKELDEYLGYVAKTGDPVYQWHLVKYLFHEKLSNVIKEFYETSPTIDLPPCPNVDPFNYERLKTSLLERLDMFPSAPFTVQRICELLTNPRKQYNRVDKFMRAIEKNILVVSTREPGIVKRLENDQTETVLNGMPDSKLNESEDRIINVCSDDLQFSNSSDSTEMPVVLHACVIQEEIEIANSVSASAAVVTNETKSWCEVNENDKDADLVIKTNTSDNCQTNVSTASASSPNSELPKTDILFTENEIKNENLDTVKTTSTDDMLSSEPIRSSTPDSPDSPEPSSAEVLCNIDNLSEDSESIQPETSETENISDSKGDYNVDSEIISEVVKESDEDREKAAGESPSITEMSGIESSQISTHEIVIKREESETVVVSDLKTEPLSPEQTQLDSSDDSSQSTDSKEPSIISQRENVSHNSSDDSSNNSELSTSVPNDTSEIKNVISSHLSTQSVKEETNSSEIIKKEIKEENVDAEEIADTETIEETSCTVEEVTGSTAITNEEEPVASTDKTISVKKITAITEISGSTADSNDPVTEEIYDEQERKEGSIIHATPNISSVESEPQAVADVSTVDAICEDQASCGTEDEAMDVDESSNQQMITSEGENEGEPMDQSDVQSHS